MLDTSRTPLGCTQTSGLRLRKPRKLRLARSSAPTPTAGSPFAKPAGTDPRALADALGGKPAVPHKGRVYRASRRTRLRGAALEVYLRVKESAVWAWLKQKYKEAEAHRGRDSRAETTRVRYTKNTIGPLRMVGARHGRVLRLSKKTFQQAVQAAFPDNSPQWHEKHLEYEIPVGDRLISVSLDPDINRVHLLFKNTDPNLKAYEPTKQVRPGSVPFLRTFGNLVKTLSKHGFHVTYDADPHHAKTWNNLFPRWGYDKVSESPRRNSGFTFAVWKPQRARWSPPPSLWSKIGSSVRRLFSPRASQTSHQLQPRVVGTGESPLPPPSPPQSPLSPDTPA